MYAKNNAVRGGSFVPVITVLGILVAELYFYNFVFVPLSLAGVANTTYTPLRTVVFNVVWTLAIVSYFCSWQTDPGLVPDAWREYDHTIAETSERMWQPGLATMCSKCDLVRPERAHHCAICEQCVMRMDHHCPWIGNCVGSGNHKCFILFALYCASASIIFTWSNFPFVKKEFASSLSWSPPDPHMSHFFFAFLLLFPALFAILLSCLFTSHICLMLQNRTTIETDYAGPSPYDIGFHGNATQLLGPPSLKWLLPIPWKENDMSGTGYPYREPLLPFEA